MNDYYEINKPTSEINKLISENDKPILNKNDKLSLNENKYLINSNNIDDDNLVNNKKYNSPYLSLWSITHMILLFFAVYLSWRCNNLNYNILHLIAAICCPHLYIIWALATRGGCGVFDRPLNIL